MKQEHLPIYGYGPLFGVGVIASSIVGMGLSAFGVLDSGLLTNPWLILVFAVSGISLTALGFYLWIPSAFGKASIDRFIETDSLCTSGRYRLVRNPCYSGIALIFTGGLLLFHNLFLMILPPLYWLGETLLVKYSEEKWLSQRFGDAFSDYCSRVNRCIPWFPKRN